MDPSPGKLSLSCHVSCHSCPLQKAVAAVGAVAGLGLLLGALLFDSGEEKKKEEDNRRRRDYFSCFMEENTFWG